MTLPDLSNVAFFALLGSLAAFYHQIKNFIINCFSIFIRTDEFTGQDQLWEILKDSKIIRWGNRSYNGRASKYIEIDKKGFFLELTYLSERRLILLYKNKVPIFITKSDTYASVYKIVYLLGTFDLKNILDNLYQETVKRIKISKESFNIPFFHVQNRFGSLASEKLMKETDGYKGEIAQPRSNGGEFCFSETDLREKAIFIGNPKFTTPNYGGRSFYWSNEVKELEREMSFFKENQNWFLEKNIPYKRGVLLHSSPGQGKSRAIFKVAEKLDIRIEVFHLGTFGDSDFIREYSSNSLIEKPKIVLIEDIDAVFDGRVNLVQKSLTTQKALSFDTLINTIQGARNSGNIFLIITTNNLNKLDPALIRPGRIDSIIEFKPICEEGRKFIAANILDEWPEMIDDAAKETAGRSAAEVENYCIELAINKIEEKRKEFLSK